MKVVVTGSSGFVGSNLIHDLNLKGFTVNALDYNARMHEFCSGFLTYRLGSFDGTWLRDYLQSAEVVIHLASESHVDRSLTNPKHFLENNVLGTQELFEAARHCKNLRQIILFSTDEVGACLKEGSFFEKGQEFKCGSVYSASKGAQEILAQAYINTYNLPIVTTRCVNIFGPNQADEKLIPTVIRKASRDEKIPVYGSGMQMRQWVSVKHVCDFLNQLTLASFIPPGSVLHITGTHEIYNIFLIHTILNLLDKPASLIEHVTDRLGHDERYSLGRTEETDVFGLTSYEVNNFKSDLEQTVKWYRERQ